MKDTVARRRSRPTFRPRLESLETRLTPTTYTVSSLADSGTGSLRAAITSVNGDTTADEIDFSVAGVIQLTSGALPAITNTVKIDGTTAPGFANAPVVEIDNHGFAGLSLNGSNSNLVSLSIVNANGPGVTLGAGNITVVSNYIGLALDGSVAANTGAGLFVNANSENLGDTIGGATALARNVISGNGGDGIDLGVDSIQEAATVEGNFIGTDPTGQAAAANHGNGITIFSSANTIGGTDSGAGNTIAFNSQSGIVVNDGYGNAILSNSIFNNGSQGIEVSGTYDEAPQLSYALESPGSTTGSVQVQVGGILNSIGGFGSKQTFTIQVFANLAGVSQGQGQLFVGSVQVTATNGVAPFTLRNASVPAGAGTTFTATATSDATSVFSNSIGFSTPNQAYVANVYQLLLSRVPDPSASAWVNDLNNGASPASVVLAIEASPEYLSDQVSLMYNLYLRRQADTGGVQYWVSFLQTGGTFEEVAASLLSSEEYYFLLGSTNQYFIAGSPGIPSGLYVQVLNRAASSAEIAGWVTLLDNGTSRFDVSLAFLTSQEYRTNLVESDYMTFLLRPADSGGLAAFVNALNAGATDQEVLAQIFGSPEGYQLWS